MSYDILGEVLLKDREREVLQFIENFIIKNGYPPTVREIREGMGVASTSTVSGRIRRLVDKGYLEIEPNVSRGIRVVSPQLPAVEGGMVQVPLLRRIIQRPELGIPHTQNRQSIPIEWLKEAAIQDVYAVEVYNFRMYDALVNPGDVIVMEHMAPICDGDTVMLVIRSKRESRIRRIYQHGDGVLLEPLLKPIQPHWVSCSDVTILGKVLGMLRRF